jgi:hypothetical protein
MFVGKGYSYDDMFKFNINEIKCYFCLYDWIYFSSLAC